MSNVNISEVERLRMEVSQTIDDEYSGFRFDLPKLQLVNNADETKSVRLRQRSDDSLYNLFRNLEWDEPDVYDLRFLFGEDDTVESYQLILVNSEINDNEHYENFNNDEEVGENDEEVGENDEENYRAMVYEPEDEDWDAENWNVRFHHRLGFIVDEYDSGIDEPYELKAPYPEDEALEPLEEEQRENQRFADFLMEMHMNLR